MEVSEMKDIILKKIENYDHVSFAELDREIGEEAKGDFWMGYPKFNIYFWAGMSEKYLNVIKELMLENKIYFKEAHFLTYLVDGSFPKLPIAKRGREYKKEHWTPIVFRPIKRLESEDKGFKKVWDKFKETDNFKEL